MNSCKGVREFAMEVGTSPELRKGLLKRSSCIKLIWKDFKWKRLFHTVATDDLKKPATKHSYWQYM